MRSSTRCTLIPGFILLYVFCFGNSDISTPAYFTIIILTSPTWIMEYELGMQGIIANVHILELPKFQVVKGVTKFNASVNIGSNQFNEWILPNAFCYGQSVDLNFKSGLFVLFSSNGVKTLVQTFRKLDDDTNPTTSQPRRNIKFPGVELYTTDNTKSNVSSYFFIISNFCGKIQICIKFGDGVEKTLNNFSQSRTISHVYNRTGNMTIKLSVFHRNKQELTISRSIMVLDHHCFQATPMFDIRNSVPSNPLTVFLFSDIIIKSRKQYDHQSDRCRTEHTDHLTYFWKVTNTETGEETKSRRDQLPLISHTPGLFKVSLTIQVGQFSTTGILYIKFIFEHQMNFHRSVLCQFVNNSTSMVNINVDAEILPVWGENISYSWRVVRYSNPNLIPQGFSAAKWVKLYYVNSTKLTLINPFQRMERGLTEIALRVNYTSSIEYIYQFVLVHDGEHECNIKYYCVKNCEIRTSLSKKYVARMNSMNKNCIATAKLHGVYDVSDSRDNKSVLQMIKGYPLSNGTSLMHIDRHHLIVQTNRLAAGKRYILKMTTGDVPWLIHLHMNSPPTGGCCEVMPKEGLVLQTEFMVVCRDWRAGAEDYNTPHQQTKVPLLYTVRYRTSSSDQVTVYQGYEASTPSFMLPSGAASQGYRVTVEVEVEDRFGDKTQTNVTVTVKKIPQNENRDLNEIPCDELDQLLAMFVLSVRKTDGQEYEPSSLRSIISSLDRKLGRQKYVHKIMDSQDDSFRLTRDALKAKQKNLKKQGKGNKPSKAEAISDEEINILYEKKILGNETPESLLYTLWFNNSIHFGLRGVSEHYNLRWRDIKLKVSSHGTEYLEYNERQTKTRTGDNIVDIRQVKPKMFSSGDIRDPVQSYKLYSAKRPLGFSSDEDPFYLSKRTIPLDDPRSDKWYLKQKVGEKKLASFMKEMAVKANFTGKKLTNHSARKHLIQKLRDLNVPPTDKMQISGHKNAGDDNYNRETYIDTLCRNLLTKLKYSQNPDTQMHAIHITANELSRVQFNDSFPNINVSGLMNADISDLRAMLAFANSSILKKLQQGTNILSESTLNWISKFSLGSPHYEQSMLSDKEACHMLLLSMDSMHIYTKNPEITTPKSIITTVDALRVLLSDDSLPRSLLRDKDKAIQAITGLLKIVDTVLLSSYYHYTDDLDELMTLNKEELIQVENVSTTFVRKRLIKDYMLSEKYQTTKRMKMLESFASILMKSLDAIEKAMTTAETGRKLSVNRTLVSVVVERIEPLSFKDYSATVGGINVELQAEGNQHNDVNILIAAFKRSPFPVLNDTSYGWSEVLVLKGNFSCNITARLRNRNVDNLHKSWFFLHSNMTFYQEFAVSMNDLTIIHLEPENLTDFTDWELYIKGGARPTEVNFDIKLDIGKHQTSFKVPSGIISHTKGYLMLKKKEKEDRRRKARDAVETRIKNNAEKGVILATIGVQVFTMGCRARSFTSASWITGGCKIGDESSIETTVCHCPHTSGQQSAFTSTFYVQPNLIDRVDFSDFDVDNAAVYGTLIVMLCLYIILVIILRKQDYKDALKWAPQFLCDNGENDIYFYMITVYTGMRRGAATMSNVNFILSGEDEDSGIRILSGSSHSGFEAGSVRRFIASSRSNFGRLNYLRIWHDNSGPGNTKSWFLNKIVVDDLQTKARYIFHCGRWLSLDRDDGRTERVLPVCTMENLNSFNTRFSEQAQLNLTDSHLLVSTLIRPESSNFSRVQRGSCLFVLMLLTMISHAMYFKENAIVSASQVKIGSLDFSLKDLYVSLMVALITTPPILCASFVFKKTSKSSYHLSRISSRKRSTTSEKYTSTDTDVPINVDLTSTFDTEVTLFPKWVLYFAWFLLFASAAVSSFFLLLYSIQWGKEKSTRWLIKFILSFLESIFIVDPGKIILMALMVALFLKNKETQYKLNVDVHHLRRLAKVFYSNYSGSLNVMRRQILGKHEPALPHDVENFKNRRQQEVRARGVFIELLTYGVFAFIMFSISYIHKDQRSFLLKQNVHNILVKDPVSYNKFANVNKTIDYFNWLNNTVVPHLYPSRDWSNNSFPSAPWVGDLVNIRVGTAKLRQVRVTEEPCISYIFHIVRPCIREYQDKNIETRNFYPYWRLQKSLSRTPQSLRRAWKYSSEDEGIDVPGEIHMYKPGGYVIMLPRSLTEAHDLVHHLVEYRWVDRHTRALFLELNLYNPNINIFTYAMFIAEFIETGGILPWSNIWVFRPNEFTGALGTYALLCYLVFLIFLCLGTFRVIKELYQRRLKFLKQIWNLVDMTCIVLSYIGIVVFSIRLDKANETIPKAKELSNDTFDGFQTVFLWDFAFNCIVGVLTFITTLRILRILGYNRRLTEIVRVITSSARDLIGFGLVFSIIYSAYVIFGFLIYGTSLSEYNTVFKSFGTLTNSLIGKNRLDMMIHVAPEAASFFYFTYTFCVIFTLLTMFSAILNYSIRKVRHQSRQNPETYGILDILSSSISNLFGMAMALQRKDKAKEKFTAKEKNLRSEKINAFGIVQLIRDIFVQSLGEEFMYSQRSRQESLLTTMTEPSDLRVNLTPECLKGQRNGDISKLERIGTLRDIQVSLDKKEDNLVQRNLYYL
ncbi:uncharacterized protein LOC133199700 [Saccostrea echinata]|uniref:uncharacterized protein LOC133199700 n=1 Tax=Saccostrea echinata TaxID=191078 RepID=UPI002A7F418E|nr:uncharacterized protein LOC133199700 [Saccostrea echinata]